MRGFLGLALLGYLVYTVVRVRADANDLTNVGAPPTVGAYVTLFGYYFPRPTDTPAAWSQT